jgi:uncharacterized protein (DUF1800 family)
MKFLQKTTAFLLTILIATPIFAFGDGRSMLAVKKLTEEQKIVHVLNRLGFGVRPNDVAKVKAMGLNKYIDQQLNPNSIIDTDAENRVSKLEVMNLSTSELFAKYPNPGGIAQIFKKKQEAENKTAVKIANPADAMMGAEETAADKAEKMEKRKELAEIYQKYGFKPAGLIGQQIVANRILRATYSEKQLQEVMVDFWQNHFNVYAKKNSVRWYIPSYERDVLRKNALGNFKDLVVGTAQHPAMLIYLDNFESISPNATQNNIRAANRPAINPERIKNNPAVRNRLKKQYGLSDAELDTRLDNRMKNSQATPKKQERGLNENYARELMELHTLGVDGGYKQADIIEVAKCFSGWTVADPRGYRRVAASIVTGTEGKYEAQVQRKTGLAENTESGTFYFNKNWHDSGEKTVFGQKIKADGINDGLKVIDMLVSSPATAKFIAKKLAVKFVSDSPSEAFVNRIAKSFTDSKGDIKTTLRTIFTDDEFYAIENYRAKIKTPFELAISSIRTLGGETGSSPALIGLLEKMGETPYGYQAPTGYGDTSEDWVNTGALLERLNYAIALSANQIPNTKVDLSKYSNMDKAKVLDNAVAAILDNDISANTKASLLKQIEMPLPEAKAGSEMDEDSAMAGNAGKNGGKELRQTGQARLTPPRGNPEVYKVISLVLGTPEFQRQ